MPPERRPSTSRRQAAPKPTVTRTQGEVTTPSLDFGIVWQIEAAAADPNKELPIFFNELIAAKTKIETIATALDFSSLDTDTRLSFARTLRDTAVKYEVERQRARLNQAGHYDKLVAYSGGGIEEYRQMAERIHTADIERIMKIRLATNDSTKPQK